MQRNSDPTAETDPPFSATQPGFTDGDAVMGIPPSIVGASIMNSMMEEIARACEGAGNTVLDITDDPEDNFDQLDDAIQEMAQLIGPASSSQRSVSNGLRFSTSGASLQVSPLPGQLLFDGRRYVITQDKLDAAGYSSFTLTATMDTYFFIAPENPGAPVNNRRTVWIESAEVAVGAAAPATPAGTVMFQRLTTDGSGVTATLDFNMNVPILGENGHGLLVRRPTGVSASADIIPSNASVSLGLETDPQNLTAPEQGQYFDKVCSEEFFLKSTHSNLNPGALAHEFTRHATTLGSSDTTDVVLYDEADWTDGTIIKVFAEGTAFNELDATDSYAFENRFIGLVDAGAFSLDTSGTDDPEWEEGVGAIAAGVDAIPVVTGGNLVIRLTGHNTASNTMRWFIRIRVIISSHETDLP